MNEQAPPITTTSTFVIRIRYETSTGEVRWRGQIEHIQSGEVVTFLDLEKMLAFINHLSIHARQELIRLNIDS